MDPTSGLPMFALMVKYRHEKTVATALTGKGYEPYVPLQRFIRRFAGRSRVVEVPLFPTYVFARFDPQIRLPILTIPGVFRIVGNANRPEPVSESEFEAIRLLCLSDLEIEGCPFGEPGDAVMVTAGPLAGAVGTLVTVKHRHRLVLSLSILNRSVAVEIAADAVERLPRSRRREPALHPSGLHREHAA